MTTPTTAFLLSGGGNDFLALVEPESLPSARRIRAWCLRGLSIGADGLFVLRRDGDAVRMDHFNADGGAAELCVNGTRCAATLARELGWSSGAIDILTGAGEVRAETLAADSVRLELPVPQSLPERRDLTIEGTDCKGWFLVVGVPQYVLLWDSPLERAPVARMGAILRRHSAFGDAGTNVMFVHLLPPGRLEIRSYERGVEAETLACGTGVLAAAATAVSRGTLRPPIEALTGGGCRLRVEGTVEGNRFTHWSLTGDARLLARVEISAGADDVPAPPAWSSDGAAP